MPKIQIKPEKVEKKWHLFDASKYVLGRMATQIAKILLAKNKAIYSPQWDLGDNVVVINARSVLLTGKKETQKKYIKHSTYPGGFKETKLADLRLKKPEKIIRDAVWGMLPKGRLGHKIINNLHVFSGKEHTFANVEFVNQTI